MAGKAQQQAGGKGRQQSKLDDGGPAFPSPFHASNPGMKLREWFAAHAPAEIPDWFVPPAQPLPIVLMNEDALRQQPGFLQLSEAEQELVRDWLSGDEAPDLGGHLAPIGEAAWKAISSSRIARENAAEERVRDRYFAWRWYYADQMLLAARTRGA